MFSATLRFGHRLSFLVDHGDAEGFGGGGIEGGDGLAADADFTAGIGLISAGKDFHQSGFAGAVLPHQGVDFAGVNLQADIFEHAQTVEGFADALHLQQGFKAHV